jgi:hypothetical protein
MRTEARVVNVGAGFTLISNAARVPVAARLCLPSSAASAAHFPPPLDERVIDIRGP